MKTPREILLQRHHAAEPKLDTIRREIVSELNNKETKQPSWITSFVSSFLGCSKTVWRELIWPSRRTWAGLAAVWVLILVANQNLHVGSPSLVATSSPGSADFIMAFRDQELMLAELTECPKPKAIEPRKRFVPQPRSDRRAEYFTI